MKNITKRIIEALDEVAESSPVGNREWTKAVKIAIGDIGIELKYEVLANQVPERSNFQSEWLFDLTWYQGSENGLQRLPLILESEWSQHFEDIRHDLEKLHIAKSPLKVMVFEAVQSNIEELMLKVENSVKTYLDNSGKETYLIFGLILDSKSYEFRTKQLMA